MPPAIQQELFGLLSDTRAFARVSRMDQGETAGDGRAAPAPAALPCLNSIICNEGGSSAGEDWAFGPLAVESVFALTPGQARTAFALSFNVKSLADRFGVERLGFLTLTFKDHVTDLKEAQRRFHSLKTGVLNRRYLEWIAVPERMKSDKTGKAKGRIHFHCLVVLKNDIRTGADFSAFNQKNYSSANGHLRSEWAFWRSTSEKYRFGRTEILPVKSSSEAIARYVAKYISKHIQKRDTRDKGHKLVLCSKGARKATTRFAWHSARGWLWRAKLAATAYKLGFTGMEQFKEAFGNSWAFHFSDIISRVELEQYPTLNHALEDNRDVYDFPADTVNLSLTSRHAAMTSKEFEHYLRSNYRFVKFANELRHEAEQVPF